VGVGNADVFFVETVAEDFGAEPAIGLELAQIVEQATQGVMGRSAGAIDGGLGSRVGAVFGFGKGAAVEAPGGADDFDSEHFLNRADGVEILPKGFGEFGVLGGFFGPDTVLGGEEAELEVVAGGAALPVEVAGPVDKAAFRRLASICAADAMGNLLFGPSIGRRQKGSRGRRL